MDFNITGRAATGGVGKGKLKFILFAVSIAAIIIVLFILNGADKKGGAHAKVFKNPPPPSTPTTSAQIAQYQQNLSQSADIYQRSMANGTAPVGAPPTTAVQPQPTGSFAANQLLGAQGARPSPYQAAPNTGYTPTTIPSTAYAQPGYAPPQPVRMPADSARTLPKASENAQAHDELERERAKRAFEARYGTSIAKTIRTAATPQTIPAPGNQSATADRFPVGLGAQLAEMVSSRINASNSNQSSTATAQEQAKANSAPEKPKHPAREPGTFLVPEGTVVDTVLQTRLNGSFAGPAKVQVTHDVYDRARRIVLIPAGSIFLGDVRPVQKIGESRLAVTFHRLQRPDGFDKDLDTFQGLDQIGETALKDKVNHHYVQIFGVSIALGAVAGLSQMNTNYGYSVSSSDMYRQGFSQSTSNSAQRILDKYTNILPTITIREGTRVKVYLTNDLYLPPSIEKPILD